MAQNLFPIGYENEVLDLAELIGNKKVGYMPSSKFNWGKQDFSKNGNYQIQTASGVEAWEDWCRICLATERYSCLAYDTDFGIETKEAFQSENRSKAESILIREITEALMADPYGRTKYVPEILFNWERPDSVSVRIKLEGIENVSIDIAVQLDSARR